MCVGRRLPTSKPIESRRCHGPAVGTPYARGHDECVSRVLIKQSVDVKVQRASRRVPGPIVPSHSLHNGWTAAFAGYRVAETEQEYRIAVDGGEIDGAGEWD